jgi:hypothetical protein
MSSFDRRDLLKGVAASIAAAALPRSVFASAAPQARAKRCVFLFMTGGPSQMDTFDPKPELVRRHGQEIVLERRRGEERVSTILGSKRSFTRYGETGQWCCDLLPRIAKHMDRLAVVKSLHTDSFAHGSGILQMNTGQISEGHPSIGAWIAYALGAGTQELPPFVVMHDPRGGPISGPANWSSGYMPAEFQGTLFGAGPNPVLDLVPEPTGSAQSRLTRAMQRVQLDLLLALDREHMAARPGHDVLDARAKTYELAYRMQAAAPETLDLSGEDPRTLEAYGILDPAGEHPLSVGPAPFGRQCLVARRLLERGVRFVQIYHGGGHQQQTWDAHFGVEENLAIHCPEIDKPVSALLDDLARTGLLDETLVVWGGEFGRMPVAQLEGAFQEASPDGRDHNPKAFTMWLAGAGVRPGSYGETDELGLEAVVDRHHVRDLHATILHLMGLDHRTLTYRWGGLDRKLTGVIDARPIRGILA